MTQPGIELRSPAPLVNGLTIIPVARLDIGSWIKMQLHIALRSICELSVDFVFNFLLGNKMKF